MLKQILSDLKVFFSLSHITIKSAPEEYCRLIRIINRSYEQIATKYPLPELDTVRTVFYSKNIKSPHFFSDFIPFATKDKRKFSDVDYQLLDQFSSGDMFGLQSTIPTSMITFNGINLDTIMRKSFVTERERLITQKYGEYTISPYSHYIFNITTLSSWHLSIYCDNERIRLNEEQNFPNDQFTISKYGTIFIDYQLGRITVHSAYKKYSPIVIGNNI